MPRFGLKIFRYPPNAPHVSAGDYSIIATKNIPPDDPGIVGRVRRSLRGIPEGLGDIPEGFVWVAGDFPRRDIAKAALEAAEILQEQGFTLEEMRDELSGLDLPREQDELFSAFERGGFSVTMTSEGLMVTRTPSPDEFKEMESPEEQSRN